MALYLIILSYNSVVFVIGLPWSTYLPRLKKMRIALVETWRLIRDFPVCIKAWKYKDRKQGQVGRASNLIDKPHYRIEATKTETVVAEIKLNKKNKPFRPFWVLTPFLVLLKLRGFRRGNSFHQQHNLEADTDRRKRIYVPIWW